jgi:hypothetical protein
MRADDPFDVCYRDLTANAELTAPGKAALAETDLQRFAHEFLTPTA